MPPVRASCKQERIFHSCSETLDLSIQAGFTGEQAD